MFEAAWSGKAFAKQVAFDTEPWEMLSDRRFGPRATVGNMRSRPGVSEGRCERGPGGWLRPEALRGNIISRLRGRGKMCGSYARERVGKKEPS